MSVKINYSKKNFNKSSSNLVLFSDEKFGINSFKNILTQSEFSYISDLLKSSDLKKKLLSFEINSKKKIVIISIKKNLKSSDIENQGAIFFGNINQKKNSEHFIFSDTINKKYQNFLGHFLHGIKLKSYEFRKYKSNKENKNITLNVIGSKNQPSRKTQLKFKSLELGTFFTRDLVSEPGNVLHPDEYAKRLSLLKKDGLKVTPIRKIKKLGMFSCSDKSLGSYLVTISGMAK